MARPSTGTNLTIAELERILDRRRSELQKLNKERNNLRRELGGVDRRIAKLEGSMGGRRGMNGGGRARNERSLNDTIEVVLQQSGRPMPVGDIVDAVQRAGYRSSSASFRGIVNQQLIKDKRFTATERGVYGLKAGGGGSSGGRGRGKRRGGGAKASAVAAESGA